MVEREGRSPGSLPTYFHLITPSASTMNTDGVARPSPKRSYTMYDCVTLVEVSYRAGKETRQFSTTVVASRRSFTLIASISAFRVSMSW